MWRITVRQKGFTLLEILLVVLIMTTILLGVISFIHGSVVNSRRAAAAQQITQIQQAALAYYATFGQWPIKNQACTGVDALNDPTQPLVSNRYISATTNPYGLNYYLKCVAGRNYLIIYTATSTVAADSVIEATAIQGLVPATNTVLNTGPIVPIAATLTLAATTTPPPGLSLTNAMAVNFTSIYHSGACVPVPVCPANMVPQILVATAAVSGVAKPPENCTNRNDFTTCAYSTSSVSSYNAYAVGGQAGMTPSALPACNNGATEPCIPDAAGGSMPTQFNLPNYWRVCLQVATHDQPVNVQNTVGKGSAGNCNTQDCSVAWGQALGNITVLTRCQSPAEGSGASFTVWQP